MKRIACMMIIGLLAPSAFGASTSGRRAMSDQFTSNARVGASAPNVAAMATIRKPGIAVINPPATQKPSQDEEDKKQEVDRREKEKAACLGNNIGLGNTFVWASKFSNVGNYSSMVEDLDKPENNVCFVRVELKSDDAKINVSDIAAVYYPMGTTITCGSWADEGKIKDRILDAKKSGRTWGTVAGVVGGAGVGVGAMELFGNSLIGGKVEGQKYLEKKDEIALVRSQLLVLKKENPTEFEAFKGALRQLEQACENPVWAGNAPKGCQAYQYKELLELLKE